MLNAVEAFLFDGGGGLAVLKEGGRGVAVKGVKSEGFHLGIRFVMGRILGER